MDSRLRGCIQLLEEATGTRLTKLEKEDFETKYLDIKQRAIKDSKSLNSPVEIEDIDINGKKTTRTITYLEDQLGIDFNVRRKQLLKEASEASFQNAALMDIKNRIDNVQKSISTNERYEKRHWVFNRDPAKKKKQMFAKAVMATIVDTNDTWGVVPLDKLIRTQSSAFFGDFWSRLDIDFGKEFPGVSAESWISKRNNFSDFTNEYHNFEISEGKHSAPSTKSREAFLVARALWEEITKKAKVAFQKQGRWMPYNRLGIKMRWNRNLAKKVSREEFINDVAPALHDVHGSRKLNPIEGEGAGERMLGMEGEAKKKFFVKKRGIKQTDLELKEIEIPEAGVGMARRRALAGKMYDDITSNNMETANWRNIGDEDFAVTKILAEEHGHKSRGGDVFGTPGKMLKFRDGDSFTKITAKYADEATMHQQLTAHITELSRDISVSKFLGGASHDSGLKKFLEIIDHGTKSNTLTQGIGGMQARQVDASIHYLETLVRPELIEQSHGTTAFNVLRNIQAGAKLGSAVVTAILDIPVFITTGSRIFNLPIFGSNGLLAHVFPGSGIIGGGKKAQIQYARYIVEMSESWQNAAAARFILNDGINNNTMMTRGASVFAHKVFQGSGLNWWTKSLQSSAAGIYGRHLGDLIQTKTTWRKLASELTDAQVKAGKRSEFQTNLMKYGIEEIEWNNLVKYQNNTTIFPNGVLDANGRLDMYKLGTTKIVETKFKRKTTVKNVDASAEYNLRSKFVAAMADAVDTMIMKPSQFDKMAGAFFTKEYVGTGAQVARTMTQFKAHPISFVRKTMARNWQHKSTMDLYMTTATIAASLIVTSAITVQLKEFLKGRPTYDASKNAFWLRVMQESGVFGIVSDLAFNMGGDKIFQSFGEARNVRPMRKMDVINTIIGPLSADILEIMTSGVSIAMGAASQDKELRAREYSDLVTLGTNLMPFKSIWWSKMLWRKYITEYFTELIDPKGYKRAQKRIKKRTYEQKGTGIFFGKPDRKPDGLLMELLK